MQIVPFALAAGVPLAKVIWANRDRIPGLIDQTGDLLTGVVESGGLAIHRVGSAIVFGDGAGGEKLLGFIESTGPQLDQIQNVLSGVSAAQGAVSTSLQYVQSLSMLTLGVSLVSPIVLLTQNIGLSNQIKTLTALVNEIKNLLTDEQVALLNAGINTLDTAMAKDAPATHVPGMLANAQQNLALATETFAISVQKSVKTKKPHKSVRLLARNLAVATCGLARCYVQMGDDATASREIVKRAQTLREATKYIFQNTAGKDTERFLRPELRDKVSLADLVQVFEQAGFAGVLDDTIALQADLKERPTAATFFEAVRDRLFRRKWWPLGPGTEGLIAELQIAVGAVEELNRILGLEKFLSELVKRKEPAARALVEIDACKTHFAATGNPFIGWAMV